MNGFVPASELDRLLKMGYGFMGAKSGCCDWKVATNQGTLEVQALAKGHDAVPGLFRVVMVGNAKAGLMRLAPGVTIALSVKFHQRSRYRKDPRILFEGVFDKLDEFVDKAKSWVVEGKMKLEILDTMELMP